LGFSIQQGFRLGDWEVYPELNRLSLGAAPQSIEGKVMAVLVELAKQPFTVISKNTLLDSVWPNQQVAEGVLTRAIYELRQVLHDDAGNASFIETVPRLGYRLICEPRALDKPVARHVTRRKSLLLVAAFVLVVSFFWARSGSIDDQPALHSVAVMPLENLTGSTAKNYVGDGLSEAIIHTIAQQPEVGVIARTSSFALRDSGMTAQEIGTRLGVTMLIEGSVREERRVQRITIQLIDTRTGLHFGSATLNVVDGDLFNAQARISKIVTTMLGDAGARIVKGNEDQSPVTVGQAYELFLKGRAALHNRSTESLRNARVYFEEALALDPQFAPAHAGLAQFYLISHVYLNLDFERTRILAYQSSRKALESDPHNVDGLMVTAAVAADAGDYETATQQFQDALKLQPGNAQAQQWYGETLIALGYLARGRDRIETALQLNPLAGSTVSVRAKAATFFLHDDKLLMLGSEGVSLGARMAPRELAVHYSRVGDASAYERQLTKYHEIVGIDASAASLLAAAMAGTLDRIELLNRLSPLGVPRDNYFARDFAFLDMPHEALDGLLRGGALGNGFSSDMWLPEFKKSRELPQFVAYVESLGFSEYWRRHGPPDACKQPAPEPFCSSFMDLSET
jgi:TolB-like protein/DNA-binding winged helix-turn-helix (wHTH) protein